MTTNSSNEGLQSQIDTLTKQVAELEAKLEEKAEPKPKKTDIIYEYTDEYTDESGDSTCVLDCDNGALSITTVGKYGKASTVVLPAPEATKFAEAVAKWANPGDRTTLGTLQSVVAYYHGSGVPMENATKCLLDSNANSDNPVHNFEIHRIITDVYGRKTP